MRSREVIRDDGNPTDLLSLEVLLDIRELLLKQKPNPVRKVKRKRKRKTKVTKAKE